LIPPSSGNSRGWGAIAIASAGIQAKNITTLIILTSPIKKNATLSKNLTIHLVTHDKLEVTAKGPIEDSVMAHLSELGAYRIDSQLTKRTEPSKPQGDSTGQDQASEAEPSSILNTTSANPWPSIPPFIVGFTKPGTTSTLQTDTKTL
jgi:hypothetical protein